MRTEISSEFVQCSFRLKFGQTDREEEHCVSLYYSHNANKHNTEHKIMMLLSLVDCGEYVQIQINTKNVRANFKVIYTAVSSIYLCSFTLILIRNTIQFLLSLSRFVT